MVFCFLHPGRLFFKTFSVIKEKRFLLRRAAIVGILQCIILLELTGQQLDGEWRFIEGNPAETLRTDTIPGFLNADLVRLPHRLMLPNRVLWYQKDVLISQDVCIQVRADDGAQVWQNGRRILMTSNGLFCLDGSVDTSRLVVRVLNNAARGGLLDIVPTTFRNKTDTEMSYRRDTSLLNLNALLSDIEMPLIEPLLMPESLPLRVNIWGDSQGGWTTFKALIKEMVKFHADLSVGVGDLVANGKNPAEWAAFASLIKPLQQEGPVMLVAGNHDYDGSYDDLKPKHFLSLTRRYRTKPYYWFHYRNVSFMVLDPNRNFPLGFDQEQLDWAKSVFSDPEWNTSAWKVLLVHQVPFGAGWKDYSGEQFIRDFLYETIQESGFDMVVGGHIHDYERVVQTVQDKKVLCMITGGAGGGLEPPENDSRWVMDTIIKKHHFCHISFTDSQVECTVIGMDGIILDKFNFKKDE